ncbi:hypothetical protein [Delftia acidovorans]|uniref:hypothetical protein n=1 Tax=Delftia acidovorans TaxID=80866 RepID=UPI002FDEE838
MNTTEAIRKHGARAVYDAANRHMAGDKERGLSTVGLGAKTMGDVYAIQSQAYAELGDAAKVIDYADANARLDELAKSNDVR